MDGRIRTYLANLNKAADRRQLASVLLGLISSLLACMQLNVTLLNAEVSYARRRLDICKLFIVFYRTKRPAEITTCRKAMPSSTILGLDLDEPVPGGTILSILSES